MVAVLVFQIVLNSKKKERKNMPQRPLDNRSDCDSIVLAKCTTGAIKMLGRRRHGSCIRTRMQNRVAHPLPATNLSTHLVSFSWCAFWFLQDYKESWVKITRHAICFAVFWSINFYSSLYGTQVPNFHSNENQTSQLSSNWAVAD